ncbi:MAG TPA: nucleotidyl transferase AbiEii/AbiGii toxin family protein [Nitrospira sp.]|nr:nucleotidyl transferase AbiEii/AbiGii toxin family protein [Nitrospira sp.]
MIRTFTPRLDILPTAQRKVWLALSHASQLGFVLYGGTAIALRLGHRPSLDFDFFTDRPLRKNELYAALPFLRRSTLLQETPDTITVLYPDSQTEPHVKLSFFGSLTFGRIGEPEMTSDGIAQVAGLDDLMATKLKVILQRIEAKDYQDIAAIIRAGTGLSRGLAGARALYGPAFQPSESLKALVYFEGGDLHRLTPDERTLLIEAATSVRMLPAIEILTHSLALPCSG